MKTPDFLKQAWLRARRLFNAPLCAKTPHPAPTPPETLEEFLEKLGDPPPALRLMAPSQWKKTGYGAAMLAKFQELNPPPPEPSEAEIEKFRALQKQADEDRKRQHSMDNLRREKHEISLICEGLQLKLGDATDRLTKLKANEKWLIGELESAHLRIAELENPPTCKP